jgi:short-subunit dehydrogenase
VTELRGARALVTGASGGLGRAIAVALGAQGAELILTGRHSGRLHQVAIEVKGTEVVADLADPAEVERLLAEAGELDILIANAGVPVSGALEEWNPDQINRALAINLGTPILLTRALLPRLRTQGSGHFVYLSSLSGQVGTRGASLYSATKFGLRGFAGGLRADLHGSGVGVSVVLPAFVGDAGMFAATGARLPRGVGTVTAAAVAAAVVKAIQRDRAQVVVAPLTLRVGAFLGAMAPGPAAALQARLDRGLSERVAAAHRERQ